MLPACGAFLSGRVDLYMILQVDVDACWARPEKRIRSALYSAFKNILIIGSKAVQQLLLSAAQTTRQELTGMGCAGTHNATIILDSYDSLFSQHNHDRGLGRISHAMLLFVRHTLVPRG